ncbi:hypothetical protein, partial [Rhizobium leguminosarum]|uniref:hypothetical protein n=1 Tax=Rhizobium leguminosarum TaxID=384 RepID=UPI0019820806
TGRGFNASSGARQEGEADAAGQKLQILLPQPNPKYTNIDTQMPATPAGFFVSSLRYIAATTLNADAVGVAR